MLIKKKNSAAFSVLSKKVMNIFEGRCFILIKVTMQKKIKISMS